MIFWCIGRDILLAYVHKDEMSEPGKSTRTILKQQYQIYGNNVKNMHLNNLRHFQCFIETLELTEVHLYTQTGRRMSNSNKCQQHLTPSRKQTTEDL